MLIAYRKFFAVMGRKYFIAMQM